ncbi:MAG TPA: LamG domain-containing protein [Planctomycetes bacterium]|nr:LamG domain-containing protein [Planctomycetota bacterium]
MVKMKNVCFVFVTAVLVVSGPLLADDPVDGVVSYWKLDEGAGTVACDLVGGNEGTIMGAEWTTGIIGGALRFNGHGDYVDCGSDPNLQFETSDLTWALWINFDHFDHSMYFLTRAQDGGNRIEALYYEPSDNLTFYAAEHGEDKLWLRVENASSKITSGQWHHLAFVVDRDTSGSIYLDGISLDLVKGMISTDRLTPEASFRIGTTYDCLKPFEGVIDEVILFNRVLEPNEVLQLYQDGLDGLGYPVDSKTVAVNTIECAIAAKKEALELVNLAIDKERQAFAALNELRESGDTGELRVIDIFRARLEILWAMARQIHAKFNLRRSIRKLESALERLTMEPEPAGSVQSEGQGGQRLRGR